MLFNPERWAEKGCGRGVHDGGTHVHLWLIHVDVLQKAQYCKVLQFSSVQLLSCVQPHRLQHTRLPYPSPTPRACSNSCPLSWWYHPTISFPVIPFSSCLQPFPPAFSFLRSQFFTSGGQIIGASASASVLPMNIQNWFPLGLTGFISLLSKGLSSFFQHHSSKPSIVQHSAFFMV